MTSMGPDHGASLENRKHFHASSKEAAPKDLFNFAVIMGASDSLLEDVLFSKGFEALRRQESEGTLVRQVEIFESRSGCMVVNSDRQGTRQSSTWCSVESTLAAVSSKILTPDTVLD